MSERRRSSRYPIDAPVRMEPLGGGLLQARAYSLAIGGLTVRSAAPLEPGRCVDVELQVPLSGGANRLQARCRVTRCTVLNPGPGYRIGLVFERLNERTMAVLERYFSSQRRFSGGAEQS